MPGKLVWRADVADDLVQPLDGEAGEKVALTEGYAHWLLRYAGAFRRSRELEAEEGDFDHVAVLAFREKTSSGPRFDERTDIRKAAGGVIFDETPAVPPIKAITAPMPLRATSIPAATPVPFEVDETVFGPRTVLVGVIDDSFNPAQEDFLFRAQDGGRRCRFASLWVQDAAAPDAASVRYGREITAPEVDALLNDPARLSEGAILDRLGVTRPRGRGYSPSPLHARYAHGCHVASLAAGYGPEARGTAEGARLAGDIRLIGVQLPVLASQDSSGATQLAATFDAIDHVFARAAAISEALGAAVPLVVNFSYGLTSGARNGASILETRLTDAIADYMALAQALDGPAPYVEVVLPAGNSHLLRTHAGTGVAQQPQRQRLEESFHVPHEDRTSSFLELWCPKNASGITLTLEAPGVDPITFDISKAIEQKHAPRAWILVPEAEAQDPKTCTWAPDGGAAGAPDPGCLPATRAAARVAVDRPLDPEAKSRKNRRGKADLETRILIALAPTRRMDHDKPLAPAGDWRLRLCARVGVGGRLEGWILRDESVSNLAPRGRQSVFQSRVTDEGRFEANTDLAVREYATGDIRRNGTLSSLASVKFKAIDLEVEQEDGDDAQAPGIAGDDKAGRKLARRAQSHVTVVAGGYAHNLAVAPYSAAGSARIYAPDHVAPSETSRAIGGILGAGTRSGAAVALNGTSVAAPQIARLIAEGVARALHAAEAGAGTVAGAGAGTGAGVGAGPEAEAEAEAGAAPPAAPSLPTVDAILRPLSLGRPQVPSDTPETLASRSARVERFARRQLVHLDRLKGEDIPRKGFHSESQARRMRVRFRAD
ncbi:hypothetical protein ACQ5SO_16180 [Rhodovulum sp. DZ06]|uniref:hypothetical protein n=1 Tax=Rhodovulum sp. DZ06 TaxID=3425126 RepID=UPI003D324C38